MTIPSLADYQQQLLSRPVQNQGGQKPLPAQNQQGLPTITLITVVFNAEATLARTLQSVIQQGYPALEYLVIDGGSTDKTLEIIQAHEAHITHWRSQPDQGLYDAMNRGLALAHGQLVGILNAGDELLPGALQAVAQRWQTGPEEAIITGDCRVWTTDNRHARLETGHPGQIPQRMIPHIAVFIPLTIYQRLGGYDLDYQLASDYDLICRCYQAAVPFTYSQQCLTQADPRGVSGDYFQAEKEFTHIRWKYQLLPRWRSLLLSGISIARIIVHLSLERLGLWHRIEEMRYESAR